MKAEFCFVILVVVPDECSVCGGYNSSCADCAGVPNGDSVLDNCNECDNDPFNDCEQDCGGEWGGLAIINTYYYDTDGDGTGCDGNNTSECDPVTCTSEGCSGDGQEGDCVHNFCSSMIPSSWYLDFSSDCDTCTAGYDECGVCGGDGIAEGTCDCAGNVDLGCDCGEVGPSGCDNACGSTLENDECGVCGGDNQCVGILYGGLIPEDFSIHSIYPNPFNPVTNIIYTLPEYTSVQILVFDLSGIQVQSLINQMQPPGYYSVDWNAISHPSGVYFARMIAGDYISTQKLMLVK